LYFLISGWKLCQCHCCKACSFPIKYIFCIAIAIHPEVPP
jgi:hypothetical protein